MQDASWVFGEVLGRGLSGEVIAVSNPHKPGVVLNKGAQHRLQPESEMLWQLHHPNVMRLYCKVCSQELQPDGSFQGYLAMERLGSSLRRILDDPTRR